MISYLPDFMQDLKEIRALLNAEESYIRDLRHEVLYALDNQFVLNADEKGISRYEKMLSLPVENDCLEARRARVFIKISEQTPYNAFGLKRQIDGMCGEDCCRVYSIYDEYRIIIKLKTESIDFFNEILKMLEARLPANILWNVVMFNTHEILGGLTHSQLGEFTFEELEGGSLKEWEV